VPDFKITEWNLGPVDDLFPHLNAGGVAIFLPTGPNQHLTKPRESLSYAIVKSPAATRSSNGKVHTLHERGVFLLVNRNREPQEHCRGWLLILPET
jgi:hypothetical protein